MELSLPQDTIDGLQHFLLFTVAIACGWYLLRILCALVLLSLTRIRPACSPWAISCAPGALRPWIRRAVASGLLGAAMAAPSAMAAETSCPMPDGIPTLDRAQICVADAPAALPTPAPPPAGTYEVAPGDSLWSISASLLTGASDEEVAAAWPELWQANRQTLGDDPSLIRPGSVLVIPEGLQR